MKRLFIAILVCGLFGGLYSGARAEDVAVQKLLSGGQPVSTWSSIIQSVGKQSYVVPRFHAPASFNELITRVTPAVVNISTTKKIKVRPFNPFGGPGVPYGPRDPFDDFFEKFFEGAPETGTKQHSLGSGFIFNEDGHILTNNHVVANADEIVVRLSDEHMFKARIVGRDDETDLAVIKIDSDKPLPYVELGDSDKLKIGDWVVAIGNPFALSHTVTAGIVSAKGRVIGAGPYDSFIQTDASINPGNSGGPLFDMNGQVVGINTAIYATGQGLGFAIPIDMAKKLVPELVKHGRVMDRGWLGVMIQGITPELAKSFGLPEDQIGALVGDVVRGSPAEKAGLKRGDVIVRFGGKEIKQSTQLPGIVATTPPDEAIKVDILRGGKEQTVEVVLGKRDQVAQQGKMGGSEGGESGNMDKLGLMVKGITESDAYRLGVSPGKGIVVEHVERGSTADDADIRPGDIIYEVNGIDIKGVKEYQDIVGKLNKGEVVRFLINRKGGTIYIAFVL